MGKHARGQLLCFSSSRTIHIQNKTNTDFHLLPDSKMVELLICFVSQARALDFSPQIQRGLASSQAVTLISLTQNRSRNQLVTLLPGWGRRTNILLSSTYMHIHNNVQRSSHLWYIKNVCIHASFCNKTRKACTLP